jgi:hypothetical protein
MRRTGKTKKDANGDTVHVMVDGYGNEYDCYLGRWPTSPMVDSIESPLAPLGTKKEAKDETELEDALRTLRIRAGCNYLEMKGTQHARHWLRRWDQLGEAIRLVQGHH